MPPRPGRSGRSPGLPAWFPITLMWSYLACTNPLEFTSRGSAGSTQAGAASTSELTLQEECDGPLSPNLWRTNMLVGADSFRSWGQRADWMADENLAVEDGLCVITAENKATGDRAYTSAVMNTGGFFSQQYGRFEARLKAPAGAGLWPIFWLRDVNGWPPAIDVAAFDGEAPQRFAGSAWYRDAQGDATDSSGRHAVSWVDDFHVYGVRWSADALVYTLDGEEWFRSSEGLAAFNVPLFPTINLSIFDGTDGSTAPDDSTPWPAKLYVDWVHVYADP